MFDKHNGPNLRRYAMAGTEFSVTFLLMLLGGLWLDYRKDSMPAYTLTGGVVGFAAALYRLVRQARQIQRLDEESRTDGPDEDGP